MTTEAVDPPEDDELFEADDIDVEGLVQQAQVFHAQIDQMKMWSYESAAQIRASIDSDSDDAGELDQVAELVKTVARRIEQGDSFRVRQP